MGNLGPAVFPTGCTPRVGGCEGKMEEGRMLWVPTEKKIGYKNTTLKV